MPAFDFSTFPVLTTPRLVLREWAAADAADLFQMNSDPEVLKYDVDPPLRDVAEAAALIEKIGRHFAARESISWAISLQGESRLTGEVVFFFYDGAYYKADLGYRMARAFWRRGIATEAVRAAVRFGFEVMGLHRVNVDTRMDNLASVRLMETLGFQHEGVRRECVRSPDGTYQNWGLYGLLEDEYRRLAAGAQR
jgi:ribosomal-protein-alanine N-acetyltransferase